MEYETYQYAGCPEISVDKVDKNGVICRFKDENDQYRLELNAHQSWFFYDSFSFSASVNGYPIDIEVMPHVGPTKNYGVRQMENFKIYSFYVALPCCNLKCEFSVYCHRARRTMGKAYVTRITIEDTYIRKVIFAWKNPRGRQSYSFWS